jgi:hypothetical protein
MGHLGKGRRGWFVHFVNPTPSCLNVFIAADDLPLNVSRETLQSNKFLKQLKQVILKRLIQLITRLAEEEPGKFNELQKNYGSVLKLGAVEDKKNSDKLSHLIRFSTNQRNSTSLNEVRLVWVASGLTLMCAPIVSREQEGRPKTGAFTSFRCCIC